MECVEQEMERLLIIRLDGVDYAFDVERIQEVAKVGALTEVPLVSSRVRGLVNLRGEVIAVIDLRKSMELPPCEELNKLHRIVIVDEEGERTGLLVDEVLEMIQVSKKEFASPPSHLDSVNTKLISGVYRHGDKVYPILSVDQLLSLG